MGRPRHMPGWSLWLAVGSMGLLAATLLLNLWTTYRSVQDASRALVRGQAVQLQSALRAELRQQWNQLDQSLLQELFDEHRELGLRYIALITSDRQLLQSGDIEIDKQELRRWVKEMKPGVHERRGNRYRMTFRRVVRRNNRRNQSGRPALRAIAIEFEATAAIELRASSRRSLTIGAGASLILLLMAGLLARSLVRRDRRAREEEHRKRLENLGQMSAVLAHEIRNPLASLKGNAQILQKLIPKGDASRDKAIKKSERVVGEAVRLEKLVNDLLAFAKSGEVHTKACKLEPWLDEVLADFEGKAIRVDRARAPEEWRLDRARMTQVLSNLIRNGLQAGSEVELIVEEREGALELRVRDDGEGIKGDPAALFDAFHTKKTQGTGLGLAVAKRLVELHNGSIEARNHSGGGAEFRIRIPRR